MTCHSGGRRHHAAVWIDTHCHLDAAEFDADRDDVVARARAAGVAQIVIPAVDVANFERVRELAHRHRLAYALGIHPMCTGAAGADDLAALRDALARHAGDPRLVAVGEIGLDHFIAGLDRERQATIFAAQLGLAAEFELPVLLHVRRAVDPVLAQLRRRRVPGGFAHAFNGSEQQADAFVELGFRLGFGGAVTFERALRIRRVGRAVAAAAIVMETDSPDIPPQWRYRTAEHAPPARRCATSPPSWRGSAPSSPACAARRSRRSPRRRQRTRSRRCRASPACSPDAPHA
jgi:TatD DNase family protein